ncbi:MAG: hypothetical protein ACR2JY_00550 [Chloroflexota bacterium]
MRTEPGDDVATGLAPAIEAELDLLLTGWAELHELPPRYAETIRLTVMQTDGGFDAAWWQELFAPVGQLLHRVSDDLAPLNGLQPLMTPSRTYLRWASMRP